MINPDESLENRHAFICAHTGGGKTQVMKQNPYLMSKKNRQILWDTHGTFKAQKQFCKVADLIKWLLENYDKTAFRVAYVGKSSAFAFEKLCQAVEAITDGNKQTVLGVDELASISSAIGKDRSKFGDLLREQRKFNLIIIASATSPAEIPKTLIKACGYKCIGQQGYTSDAKNLAEFLQIDWRELLDTSLKPLEFYIREPGKPAFKSAFKYRKNI